MAEQSRLTVTLLVIVSVTVLSWLLGTSGGGHPITSELTISAAVLFIALFKARLIVRVFMDVAQAPRWVGRSCDLWLVLCFAALFVVHFAVGV